MPAKDVYTYLFSIVIYVLVKNLIVLEELTLGNKKVLMWCGDKQQ